MAERMNPDVKAKWLTALRSGQYKRGIGALHRADDCMCPFGVLCAIAAGEGVVDAVLDEEHWLYNGSSALAPTAVLAWAGLSTMFVEIKYEGEHHTIPRLNDSEGFAFAAVADLIEEQL